MVLLDQDEDKAEYRRIIDLEWQSKKPRDLGGGTRGSSGSS